MVLFAILSWRIFFFFDKAVTLYVISIPSIHLYNQAHLYNVPKEKFVYVIQS